MFTSGVAFPQCRLLFPSDTTLGPSWSIHVLLQGLVMLRLWLTQSMLARVYALGFESSLQSLTRHWTLVKSWSASTATQKVPQRLQLTPSVLGSGWTSSSTFSGSCVAAVASSKDIIIRLVIGLWRDLHGVTLELGPLTCCAFSVHSSGLV